jgi:hypothetical protein
MTIPKWRTWEILTFEETNLNFDEVFNSSKASESYFAGCVTGRIQKSKKLRREATRVVDHRVSSYDVSPKRRETT